MRIEIDVYNNGSTAVWYIDNVKVIQAGTTPTQSPCNTNAATTCKTGIFQVTGTGTTAWNGVYSGKSGLYKTTDGAKYLRMSGSMWYVINKDKKYTLNDNVATVFFSGFWLRQVELLQFRDLLMDQNLGPME